MTTEFALPVASLAFERLSRMCWRSPQLRPMAFEALLQMRLALLIDPTSPPRKIIPGVLLTVPVQMRAVDDGIPEFSSIVFSDMGYGERFIPEKGYQVCYGMNSEELFDSLLIGFSQPVVVDPHTDHMFYISRPELSNWLAAWVNTPPARDPFDHGRWEFEEVTSHPQFLLDRLHMLLASLAMVERAYIVSGRWPDFGAAGSRLTLMVDCPESAPLERIRRALPLLGMGYFHSDVPQDLLQLNRRPGVASTVRAKLTPVYDRSVATWQMPS